MAKLSHRVAQNPDWWLAVFTGSSSTPAKPTTRWRGYYEMNLNSVLVQILSPAYGPCPEFTQACKEEMRWNPSAGHVPRGFRGACGEISDVDLVLVLAEPGNPVPGEIHSGLQSAYDYATSALRDEKNQFHRNLSKILNLCWPGMKFGQQMKKVWITESVLCSALVESGPVSRPCERACAERYLRPQLALFPKALIVALGGKARKRLLHIGIKEKEFLSVYAASPPGCNTQAARNSWRRIPVELAGRQNRMVR